MHVRDIYRFYTWPNLELVRMQWEVVLIGIWFLLGALRRACDFVIESVEARLKESFDAESRLPEEETE